MSCQGDDETEPKILKSLSWIRMLSVFGCSGICYRQSNGWMIIQVTQLQIHILLAGDRYAYRVSSFNVLTVALMIIIPCLYARKP